MPVHDFRNPVTDEVTSVYVPANAQTHEHQTQIINGQIYKRVWDSFNLAISTAQNDGTRTDFQRATEGKKMSVGDMYDMSAEMSAKRAALAGGIDPIKQTTYDKFERENGYEHPDIGKQKQRQKLREATGIIIED